MLKFGATISLDLSINICVCCNSFFFFRLEFVFDKWKHGWNTSVKPVAWSTYYILESNNDPIKMATFWDIFHYGPTLRWNITCLNVLRKSTRHLLLVDDNIEENKFSNEVSNVYKWSGLMCFYVTKYWISLVLENWKIQPTCEKEEEREKLFKKKKKEKNRIR